jgi:hypothetical protein
MASKQQPERLGDAPIEAKYREQMNVLAHFLDEQFNGEDASPRERGAADAR